MKPIDHSKTIMYKLVPKDLNLNLQYVGHTTNFKTRKNQHKRTCNTITYKNYHLKVYQMIRENGGWDEWEMIEIEKFPCDDKREAEKRERELMEEFNANLNMKKSFTSKEERIVYNNEWRNKNKTDINCRARELYQINQPKILERKKIFREKNRDVLNAKALIRLKNNRDAINARRRELRQQKKLKALKLEENSVAV